MESNSYRPIPVFNTLHPEHYENYPGTEPIQAREMYVRVNYNSSEQSHPEAAVIRIADMYIDPDQYTSELSHRPKATLIYLGGGDADALTSTGIAGYARDAQLLNRQASTDASPMWDVSHMITIAHPSGAPRTEQYVDKNDVHKSAEIVMQALQKAIATKSISLDNHVVIMGGSAGGAVATELASLMGDRCERLILEEPAAMGRHENLTLKFALSGFRDGFLRARSRHEGLTKAIKEAVNEARTSFTLPYGTSADYGTLRNLWNLLQVVFKKNPDFGLARFFGIHNYTQKSGLHETPLNHDSTKDARDKITCPVTLVSSLRSRVVNLFVATGRFSEEELDHLDLNDPQQVLDLQTKSQSLVRQLFPASSSPTMQIVEESSHAGLGRNPKVWQELLKDVQSMPLSRT